MASHSLDEAGPRPVRSTGSEAKQPPYTLEMALKAREHQDALWRDSRAPTPVEWANLRHRLARAHRAANALGGLSELLAAHSFAEEAALDSESESASLGSYHAGCLEDAQDILCGLIQTALGDLLCATQQGGQKQ